MLSIFWLFFCYILGSIPFGYLIGRISGKNVLEIGWRKTSGSNVFKNVGKWQGVLTGILDVAKGYLAVYGSQYFGFSGEMQAFSGVAAVLGHNWSIFLKFSGGRGIGTFAGAFLALSPKILGFSLIPFLVLTIIWNTSIGTLLLLAAAILFSLSLQKFETVGLFALLCLVPILIKRLSPIKEIPKALTPLILIRNRLLFDNDEALFDLRAKRLIDKKAERASFVVNILTKSVLFPPKIGWEAAKLGVKAAKKPIQLLMGFIPEKVVTEITKEDLKKMMLSASRKVVSYQEEINKINVWPVADKDTGYNLAATLLGIEGVISQKEYVSISELTQDIKDGAMINARGNAGMIFTGYLMRFLEQIKNLEKVDALKLSIAMRKGTKAAYHSIFNPVEGTILDVMLAAGRGAYEIAKVKKEKNIIKILEESQRAGKLALEETKEKMEVLKQNNVVDAGGLGFLKILEAWLESFKEVASLSEREEKSRAPEVKSEEKPKKQYDIVFQIKKMKESDLENLKEELSLTGDSMDILQSEDRIKIHIHDNFPEKIKEKVSRFGILDWKVEDMLSQIRKISERKLLGLVVEETADLPREFLEKNGVMEVPFFAKFPDGEIIKKESLFKKMEEAIKTGRPLPITSAPSFKEFVPVYERALERFQEILVITLSSKLSGTYSSARIARSMMKEKQRITVFDCFSAEIGEGLVAFKIQELILKGKDKKEILDILRNFCPQVKVIGGIKDFNYASRSGRISLSKIIAKAISFFPKIGIWFLFGIKEGKVKFFGIRFNKSLVKILAHEVRNNQKDKDIKVAISYGNNLKEALELKKELEKEKKVSVLFVSQVSSGVGVYTGPEVLIVGLAPALE